MTDPIQSELGKLTPQGPDRPENTTPLAEAARSVALSEPERRHPLGSGPRVIRGGSWPSIARPSSAASQSPKHSGFQRTVSAIRTVLPAVQKLLPLLDGNVASVVANLLAPRPQGSRVDVAPIEDGLARLRSQHVELHSTVEQQTAALKRLDSQLTTVKETSERTVQGQRNLSTAVETLRTKVIAFSWIGLFLLVISIVLNVVLLVRIEKIPH